MLYQPDKRFHFVLTEAALRYRLCPPDVMLGRLDRLVSLSMLRNVKLGIIGFDVEYDVAPAHGFWLLDEDRVMVETFSAELNLAQPQETELYARIFAQLAPVEGHQLWARRTQPHHQGCGGLVRLPTRQDRVGSRPRRRSTGDPGQKVCSSHTQGRLTL
nr:Scr1 family TA system antitoxin-like transcriptional regulator [Amycolatopsis taiwanensis]